MHVTSTLGEHNERQRGYREAMLEAGLMPEFVELGFHPSLGIKREMLYRYLDERADTSEPVDAVFASNDNYAALTLGWARARGIRVPEDFQVVGYDGTQSVQVLMPELATVVQPIEGIAERAAQRLLELIELQQQDSPAEEAPPITQAADVLPIELHLGATVRSIPDLDQIQPDMSAPNELQ